MIALLQVHVVSWDVAGSYVLSDRNKIWDWFYRPDIEVICHMETCILCIFKATNCSRKLEGNIIYGHVLICGNHLTWHCLWSNAIQENTVWVAKLVSGYNKRVQGKTIGKRENKCKVRSFLECDISSKCANKSFIFIPSYLERYKAMWQQIIFFNLQRISTVEYKAA